MSRTHITQRRGGVAILTLLLIAGAALTVALTVSAVTLASSRSARDQHFSDRAFAAAESGTVDAVRRTGMETGLSVLPDFFIDGMTVTRTVAVSGDVRTVTSTATLSGVVATVRAQCSVSSGSCAIRRQ